MATPAPENPATCAIFDQDLFDCSIYYKQHPWMPHFSEKHAEIADPNTFHHCMRVSTLARVFSHFVQESNVYDLNQQDLDLLCSACLVHDVGQLHSENYDILVNYRYDAAARYNENQHNTARASHPQKGKELLVQFVPEKEIDSNILEFVTNHHYFTDSGQSTTNGHNDSTPPEQRIANLIRIFNVVDGLDSAMRNRHKNGNKDNFDEDIALAVVDRIKQRVEKNEFGLTSELSAPYEAFAEQLKSQAGTEFLNHLYTEYPLVIVSPSDLPASSDP